MATYQKLGKQFVHPVAIQGGAFDAAAKEYQKYNDLDFGTDLLHYLRYGFVVSRPNFFVMAKPIERDGKRGWWVQMLVGSLGELLTVIPCRLDFVSFCRNNDRNVRVIDFDECVKKVAKMYGYKDDVK